MCSSDLVNVLVQKKANTSSGQSGASALQGARFTVRYYDTTDAASLSKDYATRCAAAKKKWVYETDSKGRVLIRDMNPVSGDSVYTNSKGQKVFPIGTYVVEESLAPDGYLVPDDCNDRTFIVTIKGDNSSSESTTIQEYFKPSTAISADKGNGIEYKSLSWNSWTVAEIKQ